MDKHRILARVALGSSLYLASCVASADVLLQLERRSDTEVLLVGSGALGTVLPVDNRHALFLIDPFSTRPSGNNWILVESELTVGASYAFNFANDAGPAIGAGAFENTIYVGRVEFASGTFPPIPSGEPLSGSMLLSLDDGATFKPIGTRGQVFWGTTNGSIQGVLSGSWEMVAANLVPEPTPAESMLGGLAVLALLRMRPKRSRNVVP